MNSLDESLRRVALAEDAGARLDVVVGRRFPSISRRMARRLALEGKVHLDGLKQPPSTRVQEGQLLAICVNVGSRTVEGAEILEVTDRFVYALKPADGHTHRFRPDEPASLADCVRAAHPECADASDARREGGAIHRLDFGTSGVVAFARTRAAWNLGRDLFSSGRVAKQYLAACAVRGPTEDSWPPALPDHAYEAWLRPQRADLASETLALVAPLTELLVHRTPPTVRVHIRAPLGTAEDRRKMEVRLDGQRASTLVSKLGHGADTALFHVQIETGLRHQIRAHLSWIGAPILGDSLYGPPSEGRLRLHSWMLQFMDEEDPEPVVIAPPPRDLIPSHFSDESPDLPLPSRALIECDQ
jgi:23S rRNA pseudouridine1911/1915/1917 synthase